MNKYSDGIYDYVICAVLPDVILMQNIDTHQIHTFTFSEVATMHVNSAFKQWLQNLHTRYLNWKQANREDAHYIGEIDE